MHHCPECGGKLQYMPATKHYACKSCGLSMTHQELIEARRGLKPASESEENRHKREREEYLKWWLSKKK